MTVVVSLLRGVNLAGHNRVKMDALRSVYESLGFQDVETLLQSGNVIFRTKEADLARLRKKIESAIERACGFRCDVILRTTADLRQVIAKNPFAKRSGIDPARFLVTFLTDEPSADACEKCLAIPAAPEELKIHGRELYIYFPNGLARPKLSIPRVEKTLQTSGTGRNWNTVQKLLEMTERLEGSR
jgi:uncharacterized protein (DUF1697 family)